MFHESFETASSSSSSSEDDFVAPVSAESCSISVNETSDTKFFKLRSSLVCTVQPQPDNDDQPKPKKVKPNFLDPFDLDEFFKQMAARSYKASEAGNPSKN
ncbi:unnamed protein product [Caenorhabditis sp. 36 PRJEB53466]|nr:unnamed protein product [Caenorhabditis sp. 36 PRJEB53466]